MTNPYDDGWLLDTLATEIKLNDPRTQSVAIRSNDDGNRAERNETEDVLRARGPSESHSSHRK